MQLSNISAPRLQPVSRPSKPSNRMHAPQNCQEQTSDQEKRQAKSVCNICSTENESSSPNITAGQVGRRGAVRCGYEKFRPNEQHRSAAALRREIHDAKEGPAPACQAESRLGDPGAFVCTAVSPARNSVVFAPLIGNNSAVEDRLGPQEGNFLVHIVCNNA